jgi:hypothetical protein
MSHHDHDNDTLGSLATPCNRCGIEFAYQCDIPRLGWVGVACKAYTREERTVIQHRWLVATA